MNLVAFLAETTWDDYYMINDKKWKGSMRESAGNSVECDVRDKMRKVQKIQKERARGLRQS